MQAKHANGEHSWGIDGEAGKIVDMKSYGLYESASVKVRERLTLATNQNSRSRRSKYSKRL